MYLSNTSLFDGKDMYRIYCIENNYMFRHLTMTIFRLRNEKKLVSSYTRLMWAVYSGEVRGEVGTRVHLTSYLPTAYSPHKSSIAAY